MTASIEHYAPFPTPAQLSRLADELGVESVSVERRIEGGLGCTMDVLATARGSKRSRRAVLRRYGPWAESEEDHPAMVEAHALQLAARHGVPVPELVWADHHDVFAEPTVVISYIDGEPLTRPDDPMDWAEQLAEAVASIHSVPLTRADYEVIEVARPGSNDDGRTVPDALARHELGEALWETILRRRSELVEEEDCFLHADFWPGNTLWSDGRLVAVVDWEQPAIGDPALDIAYAASDMRYVGLDQAAGHFVRSYRQRSGRSLPNLEYWAAISLARPMPDIGVWHPSFVAFGHDVTLDQLRHRHAELIRQEITRN